MGGVAGAVPSQIEVPVAWDSGGCQIHKRRVDRPETERAWVDQKLAVIFANPNPDRGE